MVLESAEIGEKMEKGRDNGRFGAGLGSISEDWRKLEIKEGEKKK